MLKEPSFFEKAIDGEFEFLIGDRMFLARFIPDPWLLPFKYYYYGVRSLNEPELYYVKKLVPRRGVAIDIGGFEGLYSYALAKVSREVHCFEPQPQLAQNIERYPNPRIRVHNMGLSDHEGQLTLRIPIINGVERKAQATFRPLGGPSRALKIPVKCLDDFQFTDVTLVKIDVEGLESQVIAGGVETIRREKPVLLVEIEQRHLDPSGLKLEDVFRQILELGYRGSFLERGNPKDIKYFDYDRHQKPYLDQIPHKDYVNNFIFKPES